MFEVQDRTVLSGDQRVDGIQRASLQHNKGARRDPCADERSRCALNLRPAGGRRQGEEEKEEAPHRAQQSTAEFLEG